MAAERIEIDDVQIARRSAIGHKGDFGRALVVGGSVGMSGAVCLAATATLRAGAGLVTAVVPQTIQNVVAGYEPSYMTAGLPTDESGQLSAKAAICIQPLLAGKDSVAIGPGLGQSAAAGHLLSAVLQTAECPVVLDADALNLAASDGLLKTSNRKSSLILTPHPGEFSRQTGLSISAVNSARKQIAEQFAAEHQVVVVLKGAGTVVTNGSFTFVNETGNSGMATGGSGDVLTGIVAGILAQGADPFAAASVAVHLHGLAGDLGAQEMSEHGLIASDLLRFLGAAWRKYWQNRT